MYLIYENYLNNGFVELLIRSMRDTLSMNLNFNPSIQYKVSKKCNEKKSLDTYYFHMHKCSLISR